MPGRLEHPIIIDEFGSYSDIQTVLLISNLFAVNRSQCQSWRKFQKKFLLQGESWLGQYYSQESWQLVPLQVIQALRFTPAKICGQDGKSRDN